MNKSVFEIKEILKSRALDVCQHLFPNGKLDRNTWEVADLGGSQGQSLRIQVAGPKLGVWCDFANRDTDKGGNLLQLWMAARRLEFGPALDEIKKFLGIKDEFVRRTARSDKKEQQEKLIPQGLKKEYVKLKKEGAIYKWLTETRKIVPAVLDLYRIGESKDGKCIVFPSFDAAGTLISIKFRNIEDKKKMFVLPRGGKKLLFGIQGIAEQELDVFITEGELDTLAMAGWGFPSVSVPFGAKSKDPGTPGEDPNSPWIEHDFDWLSQFERVTMAMDKDEPGEKATQAIARRMGRERCRIMDFPGECKDPNECLMRGIPEEEIYQAVAAARNLDPIELRRPSSYRDEVWNEFYPADGQEPGDEMPWHLPFRLRDAETTVWQGFTGHGKTVGLQYVLGYLATRGRRCCVGSFEIPARRTIQNILRQLIGKRKPADEKEFDYALFWMDDRFWLYDTMGTVEVDSLLECFAYAAKKYDVQHFVIDSLMMCNVDEDDNESQKVFMNKLWRFTRQYEVHLHLVAHSKKPDSKHPEDRYWPGKYGVRGSAHIVDLADNVCGMWRNKKKEEKIRDLEDMGADADMAELVEARAEHDAIFFVNKQRINGDEPVKQLFFDKEESWQFTEKRNAGGVNFIIGEEIRRKE